MNNALAREFVDERNRGLQRSLGGAQIVGVDGRPDVLERVSKSRPELPVMFPVFQALAVRFQRRCVRCHVVWTLQKLLILTYTFRSSGSPLGLTTRPRSPQPPAERRLSRSSREERCPSRSNT